jgi:hypothetical protein
VKLTLIRAPSRPEIPVEQVVSIYAPPTSYYLINDPDDPAPIVTIQMVERERDIHKGKYENVLKGLEYWKSRALTK